MYSSGLDGKLLVNHGDVNSLGKDVPGSGLSVEDVVGFWRVNVIAWPKKMFKTYKNYKNYNGLESKTTKQLTKELPSLYWIRAILFWNQIKVMLLKLLSWNEFATHKDKLMIMLTNNYTPDEHK